MYLLVSVTLIVAVIGIYSQALSVQTARFYSHQTNLADTMLTWNATAVALATYAGITPAATGCDLTANGILASPCQYNTANVMIDTVNSNSNPPTTCVRAPVTGLITPPCWTGLPTGYKKGIYQFYSIFYITANAQKYVLTFVPPPTISAANPAPGNIMLPSSAAANAIQIGLTMSDFLVQMKNNGVLPLFYGITTQVGGVDELVTPSISNGGPGPPGALTYTLPAGVPVNSIAIISPL